MDTGDVLKKFKFDYWSDIPFGSAFSIDEKFIAIGYRL